MNLAEKIKKIRSKHYLTQEQFAQELNVSRKTVSGWENGRSYPDINTLVKISNSFNLSLDYLMKENNEVVTYYQDELSTNKRHKIAEAVIYFLLILFLVLSYLHIFLIINADNGIIFLSTFFVLFIYLIIYPTNVALDTSKKLIYSLLPFMLILFINLFLVVKFNYSKQSFTYFESIGYMTATFFIDLILSSSLFVLLRCKPTIFKKFKIHIEKATK